MSSPPRLQPQAPLLLPPAFWHMTALIASLAPYPQVASTETGTRGPCAAWAVAASSWADPALPLPIRTIAVGLPAGSAISVSWISRQLGGGQSLEPARRSPAACE